MNDWKRYEIPQGKRLYDVRNFSEHWLALLPRATSSTSGRANRIDLLNSRARAFDETDAFTPDPRTDWVLERSGPPGWVPQPRSPCCPPRGDGRKKKKHRRLVGTVHSAAQPAAESAGQQAAKPAVQPGAEARPATSTAKSARADSAIS